MSEGIKLSEVCKIKGGSGFPEKYQGKKAGKYPFIKVSDMNLPENRQTITKANNYVDDNLVKSLGLTVFPENTIVFAKVGAAVYLNKRRILSEDTIIDNNMMGVVPHHIDYFFLYYLLLNVDLSIFTQPGALPSVNQNIVGNLLIPNYRLERQIHIRNILGSIDRAIAHTEALIEKYQQIKAGLMHDLFTRGIGADGKLRPPRDEAPELYQESAIGWIPKDWEIKLLGELCNITSGGTPNRSKSKFWGGNIPWIKTGEIKYNRIEDSEEYITKEGLNSSSAKLFREGTVVMAIYGEGNTRGRVAILGIDCASNQACVGFEFNNLVQSQFMYFLFEQKYCVLRDMSNDGSQKNLSATLLKNMSIAFPRNQDEQERITNFLLSINQKIEQEREHRTKLHKQKSGLMHDLLTGKVPVKVASDEVDYISN
ncbi:restriction endonuclease subunit S [Coleofasciculus sp. F4-SAH-05]|uniref:restriction endonuclease subunit S n=1 Tax=Coleofasciculus sp. F4-SAH-05 TaxID=3069525 RepID=UPI0032F323EA